MLKAKPNPVGTTVTTLTMGHSNDRLALVRAAIGTDALSGSGSYLMDLRSLEPVRGSEPTKNENNPRHIIFPIRGHNSSFRDFVHRRANGDMSLVTEWCTSHSPTGVGLIRITGTKSDSKYEHTSAGFLAIGDDNRVYTSGGQIMNSQLTAIGRVSGGVPIPDIGGSFMVTMDANEPKVYASGSTKPIVTLPKLNGFGLSQDAWTRSSFTMDRRIVFAPQLEYLIYIPIANDEIVLRPFDLDTALRDSGVDYLIVTSSPDGNVTPGRLWTYSLDVIQNKNSKLKYSLQAAPDGMTISPSGDISWKVPRNFDQSVDVIVLVENSNFDSTFHNFELRPE